MALISILYDNETYLDPIVKSVTWSGDITQASRRLDVTLHNTLDGVKRAIDIELGREIRLLDADGAELFRGVIFVHDIDHHGQMTITAYDEAVYLTKNSDSKRFVGMTAAGIVRELCADFSISIGTITETDYVIPKLILRDRTLWDMMTIALTETRKATGRRFFIYSAGGRLNLVERREKVVDWVLENGVNIIDASYSQSIEELRSQVKVVSNETEKKKSLVATLKDDALIARFGLMQHYESVDSDKTQAEVDELARRLLEDLGKISDDARLTAVGNNDVIAGTAVYVREAMTSIVGGFYVITDSHTYEGGTHRMSLTISGDESLPTMYYDEPDEAAKKSDQNAEYSAALAQL